jgi:hypothetical protein
LKKYVEKVLKIFFFSTDQLSQQFKAHEINQFATGCQLMPTADGPARVITQMSTRPINNHSVIATKKNNINLPSSTRSKILVTSQTSPVDPSPSPNSTANTPSPTFVPQTYSKLIKVLPNSKQFLFLLKKHFFKGFF